VADDGNDKPSNAQGGNLGAGKDVLFGWLIGRAAADFGLAQALAANEAQRAEQFRRLEDSLLAQIQELQNQPYAAASSTAQIGELHQLKTEMQSIFERMGGLESLAEQFTYVPDLLKSEVAALESQSRERHKQMETDYSRFAAIAETLGVRVQQLENQSSAKPEGLDRALGEFADCRLQLRTLAERIGRTELSVQNVQSQTLSDIEREQKLAADRIRGEFATFKADVFERLREQQPAESAIRTLKESLQKRVDDFHHEIERNTSSLADLGADLAALTAQLQTFTQRVESTAEATASALDFDAERARLTREVEDQLALRIRDFGDEIQSQLRGVGETKVDRGDFNAEIVAFVDRMANIERAVEQTAVGIRFELNSIKSELSEERTQRPQAEALLKNVEETVRTKIEEIQQYLAQEKQRLRARDLQHRELETQMARLAQRIKEIESTVQQTHALMINETAQATQQRGGLAAALAALRAELDDVQARDAVSHGVTETLNTRIRELQVQLTQQIPNLDRRDTEMRELKAQLQSLTEQMARVGAGLAPSRVLVANRIQETAAMPRDLRVRDAAPAVRLDSALHRLDVASQGPQESREGDGSKDQILVEDGDPLKLMQARMSADIERARAELREKSGRWKVRR
jgi:chromosome segregation ATPase